MDDLEELKSELEAILRMPEAEVCERYNVDYKQEIIEVVQDEIKVLESHEESFDYTEEELERERTNLCLSQGIGRYC